MFSGDQAMEQAIEVQSEGESDYAEELPSETYEPTYHRPKVALPESDSHSEEVDTYENLQELGNQPDEKQ